MTREEVKKLIRDTVTERNGMKATELAAIEEIALLSREFPIFDLVEELVREGRLVEVEYVLPGSSYRAKSFLLPQGSGVNMINKEEGA